MASVSISGVIEVFTLETLRMGLSMARASGGNPITPIVINMMENITWTRSMATEYFPGRVGTCTRGITRMMKGMVLERCIGPMGRSIRVNGLREFSMVTGY